MTMPVPEVSLDEDEYMRWLDCFSFDMPPMMLIRGQKSVLTFDL